MLLVLLCCPLCTQMYRFPELLTSGQKRFISCPDCDPSRWGEVRSAASQPPSQPPPHSPPCRLLTTRLADALLLSLGDERQPWLRANGFACFYWKALANERTNSCWAGCLRSQSRFRLTAPSAGGHRSCFFVSCQVTLPTPGCVAVLYKYKLWSFEFACNLTWFL